MLKYQIKFDLKKRKDKATGKLIKENVPIVMIVTFNQQRLYYYTGFKVNQDNWVTTKKEGVRFPQVSRNHVTASGHTSAIINHHLAALRNAVNNLFQEYKIYPTIQKLRDDIRKELGEEDLKVQGTMTLANAFDNYVKERSPNLSPGRIRHFRSLKNLVTNYYDENRTIDNVTTEQLKGFQNWLKTYTDSKGNKKTRANNTITSKLKHFRALFSYAEKEAWTNNNPFKDFKIEPEKYSDPVFLTRKERDELYNFQPKQKYLERVKDRFILQCFIGCRIGDFEQLTKDNIHEGNITYIPGKGAGHSRKGVTVPLSAIANEIINKYDIPGGYLVPPMTSNSYNKFLKKLFEEAGLNRPVIRYNEEQRKNEVVPLFQMASSHMARRTFVGILHKTVKNEVIASMTGHTENSRAFRRYYNVDNEDRKSAIDKL